LYLNANQSKILRIIYQYCLSGRFEHNVKEGGGVTKWESRFVYITPSNYTQVLLKEYVRSGDHFKAAKKAPELISCLISTYT